MEDYAGAHGARKKDVEVLLGLNPPRATVAAHLGGVAVECRLKALLINYHRIAEWDELGARPKDTLRGQPIERPGHGLLSTLRLMADLYRKAKADPLFLNHLNRIMHPTGATGADFIELRYAAEELAPGTIGLWQQSLQYVLGWLKKHETVTL